MLRRAMDDEAGASSLFFHASHASDTSGERPARLANLAASFQLHDAEVAFFDAVIDALPVDSQSFVHLKRAYDAQMAAPGCMTSIARALQLDPDESAAVDARLWNTLLALVQVRGQTWAERWDAVRVSIGLDPREPEEEAYSMHALRRALGPSARASTSSDAWAHTPEATPWTRSSAASNADFRAAPDVSHSNVSSELWPHDPDRSTMDLEEVWRPRSTWLSPARVPSLSRLDGSPSALRLLHTGTHESDSDSDDFEPRSLHASFRRHDVRKSDVWHTQRLLTRALGRWYARFVHEREALLRADRAHDRYVALQALTKWRAAALRAAQNADVAAQYARAARLHHAWHHWSARIMSLADARRSEHRAALRAAFHELDARKSREILGVAWTVRVALTQLWKQAHERRLAAGVHTDRLLRTALDVWLARTLRARRDAGQAAALAKRRAMRTLHMAWARWLEQASLRHTQAEADARFAHRRRHRAWQQWRTQFLLAQVRRATHQTRQASADHLYREHSLRRLRRSWTTWVVHERAAVTETFNEMHMLRAAWQRWWTRFTERTIALEGTSTAHAALEAHGAEHLAAHRVRCAWKRWRSRTEHVRREHDAAARTHTFRTLWRAWSQWRTRREARMQQAQHADALASHNSLLHAWLQWRSASRLAAAHRLRSAQDRRRLAEALQTWRMRHAQAYHWKACTALLRSQTAGRLQRHAFHRWHQHTQAQAHRETVADSHANVRSARRALAHWRARCRSVRALDEEAVCVQRRKNQGTSTAHIRPRARRPKYMEAGVRAPREAREIQRGEN